MQRRGSNIFPLVWRGSLESGMPAKVSSSPSDHDSKSRVLSKIALVLLQRGSVSVPMLSIRISCRENLTARQKTTSSYLAYAVEFTSWPRLHLN
ncbi:hypothetical protein AVEN_101571-1 [Araneus ventricosus]|uniref:Uncharacterized protein n=1 Tax=Araneus ventricosus TaxID=182803 RepID=A0A4Y2NE84_ARAVE|nr:hypothetical protein AVEN_101571-1 [Araneus ventricosus]